MPFFGTLPPCRASARTWAAPGAALFFCPARPARNLSFWAVARQGTEMLLFILKAVLSGLLVAAISTVARRYPGWGGLVASLPLVSVLSMVWLYGETRDVEGVAKLSLGAFWFFLPSMPMFLLIPAMLRSGVGFVVTMITACLVTVLLYAGMNWLAPRVGIVL